jgi:hypothetical protein
MRTFAHPPAAPSPFEYRSIEPSYGVYGWRVAVDRPALEFSELRGASRRGFELLGSGSATVTTARLYAPRAKVVATVRNGTGNSTRTLTADRAGRVSVAVPIGPGNASQQYSPGAVPAGTTVYAAKVTLRARRRHAS